MAPQATDDLQSVQAYYGKVLQSNKDLQTSACCSADSAPAHVRAVLADIHDEVMARFYGCGTPIPDAVEGLTVLDLGSGTGRDCYVLSKLTGPTGHVIGVDMTDEQLAIARAHQSYHADKFGYAQSNVEFRKGYIEDLASAGIADASIDLVVSNCVINLSPDKPRVFRELFRVLKPGGEIYISDVFADRRIPDTLRHDPLLLGECLAGAMYIEDFRRLLRELGCLDFRTVSAAAITQMSDRVRTRVGHIGFSSRTVRAFKLDLEDQCEDYGEVATYRGTIPEAPHFFVLDDHHRFEAHRPMLVCGNTSDMLRHTRFARHFHVDGDRSRHFGLFPCGPAPQPDRSAVSGACC